MFKHISIPRRDDSLRGSLRRLGDGQKALLVTGYDRKAPKLPVHRDPLPILIRKSGFTLPFRRLSLEYGLKGVADRPHRISTEQRKGHLNEFTARVPKQIGRCGIRPSNRPVAAEKYQSFLATHGESSGGR